MRIETKTTGGLPAQETGPAREDPRSLDRPSAGPTTRRSHQLAVDSGSPEQVAAVPADGGSPPIESAAAIDSFVRSLYAEYAGALVSVVMRLNGGDRQWAEDVVQETFLRAWRHTHGLLLERGSRSMMPWLVTVARRIVINDRRSRSIRPMEVDDTFLAMVAVPDDTERTLLRTILNEALAELTPAHRSVIVEMCFRDRTTEEVSHMMGVPSGTVKSRMYYALRAMRAALESRGVPAYGRPDRGRPDRDRNHRGQDQIHATE